MGEWKTYDADSAIYIITRDREYIAQIDKGEYDHRIDLWKNATLIELAPLMFDTLKKLSKTDLDSFTSGIEQIQLVFDKLREYEEL